MTREQSINYLKSSGMSDEQIKSVTDAFTCEDAVSKHAVLETIDSRIEQIKRDADAINKSYSHLSYAEGVYNGYCRLKCDLWDLPSVTLLAEPCDDCISRTELLAKIDEERKHLLALKMDGAEHILVHHARRIIEELQAVTPKGVTITDFADRCRECGKNAISREKIKEALEKMERGLQSCFNMIHCESNHDLLGGQERAFKYCIETLKEVLDEYNTEVDGGNEFFNFDSPMAKGENDNES